MDNQNSPIVTSWSGELAEHNCPECQENKMEIVKRGTIIKTTQGPEVSDKEIVLKCINPDCQHEELPDERPDTDGVDFIDLPDAQKSMMITQRRNQVYSLANRAKNKREQYVPVHYTDLPDEPTTFEKYWSATPMQLLKGAGIALGGSAVVLSLIWGTILGLAFVLNLLFTWSFFEGVISATGIGFIVILVIAALIAIAVSIFIIRNDQFNGVVVQEDQIQLAQQHININMAISPYILVDDQYSTISVFNIVGENSREFTVESMGVTDDEFFKIITALNNQNAFHARADQISEDEDIEVLERDRDDIEFFYQVYSERVKSMLYNQLGMVERTRKLAEQRQPSKPSQEPAAVETPQVELGQSEATNQLAEPVDVEFEDDKSSGTISFIVKSQVLNTEDFSVEEEIARGRYYLNMEKSVDNQYIEVTFGQDATADKYGLPDNLDLGRKIRVRISIADDQIDRITFNGRQLDLKD